MVMLTLIFLTLSLWIVLSIYALISILFKSKKDTESTKALNQAEQIEQERINRSKDLLDSQPLILSIVSEIVNLEKLPPNETRKMRAAILRAKLKLSVRNPVIRRALFDAVKLKKK